MTYKSLFLDSNLVVLWVIGTASLGYLGSHKNVKGYTKADFYLLLQVTSTAPKILTTPNILTEASNLVRQIGGPALGQITKLLGDMIAPLDECYVQSRNAAKHQEFSRLGLTDCAILDALGPAHRLLTADFDLYLAALNRGHDAVNFNHLRQQSLS